MNSGSDRHRLVDASFDFPEDHLHVIAIEQGRGDDNSGSGMAELQGHSDARTGGSGEKDRP